MASPESFDLHDHGGSVRATLKIPTAYFIGTILKFATDGAES